MRVDLMLDFLDFCSSEGMTELATIMMYLTSTPDEYQLAAWVVDHYGFVTEYLESLRRLRCRFLDAGSVCGEG